MDLLKAFLLAFLPIGGLTFLVTYLSYRNGFVRPEDDLKDEWDISAHGDDDEGWDNKPSNNFIHQKWLSFGGGYYGLMALLTFTVIEAQQIYSFATNFPGWQAMLDLLNVQDLVDIFVSQIMNLVDAFIWFIYWPDRIYMHNGWVWLGLSYAGYFVGSRLARLRLG